MLINDEIQKQVLTIVAKASVPSATDTQQRAGALLQLNPGQQVKAEIITNLPNSLYLARIAGEVYKLEIPLNIKPGETMDLTFVSAEPRIVFQLMRPEEGGEAVKLSSMGKWLAGVVQNAPALRGAQETLVEDPVQASTLLAQRLKAALTQSGLFYESHLAKWAAGALQLGEILKEPQGRLSRAVSGEAEPGGSGEKVDDGFADTRMLPLIREQLLLLNSGVLSWQGQAWPGQGMELAVKEREAEEDGPAIEATLALDLPQLGGGEAKLRFGADGLMLDFVCQRTGSSQILREGAQELRAALASSGVQLNRMAAKDEETVE